MEIIPRTWDPHTQCRMGLLIHYHESIIVATTNSKPFLVGFVSFFISVEMYSDSGQAHIFQIRQYFGRRCNGIQHLFPKPLRTANK